MPAIPALIAVGGTVASKMMEKKPQAAQLMQGATTAQANEAYGNTQQGLQQQQGFVNALQGQNGIQNQSNVYDMYAQQAAGGGPNPAQMALQNATGQNVAAQNALMAGQRGAGANPALAARQAAMQGANIQQQAVGQAALMQAQQQQAAMGQMGNISGQQVNNLGNANNAYANSALQQQGNVLNSINAQNNAAVGQAANMNSANQAQNAANNSMMGGLVNAAGAAAGKMDFSSGAPAPSQPAGLASPQGPGLGVNTNLGGPTDFGLPKLAGGGQVKSGGAQSSLGRALAMMDGGEVPGQAEVSGDSLKNDTVHALLSPGEIVLPRTVVQGKDAPKRAAEFVAAIQSRKRKK